jgi:hypothetical protein
MTVPFYELAILGAPPIGVLENIREDLASRLAELGFTLGEEVSLFTGQPIDFRPTGERCAAALCFSTNADQESSLAQLMERGIAIIPVAAGGKTFNDQFPGKIAALNGLTLEKAEASGLNLALMECASLLPRQRRVFISYRQAESTEAALQLYAALSSRLFDVFLDTHDIHPGKHFQEVLWQRLCDSDVMLMLDTANYFDSRWTDAELGRATWRGIPLVRAAWPGVAINERAQLATSIDLENVDFDGNRGQLTDDAIKRICNVVEDTRTRSVAFRFQQLFTTLRTSVARAKGEVHGLSLRRSLIVTAPNGKRIAVYPALGVPTSYTLHDATLDNHPPPVAVVYDEGGVEEKEWLAHMDWISQHVRGSVRLVSSYRAGWDFSDWN